MKKSRAVWATGFLVLWMTGVANAAPITVINSGFETGDFTGWSTSGYGDAGVVKSDEGYLPTEGSYFANLIADKTLSQNVSWNTGDTFSFYWNFNANDWASINDYSIFQIKDSGNNVIANYTLSDTASIGDYNATGWNSFTHTFTSTGSGSINFGVFNVQDKELSSQLYVDAPAPEPGTCALMGIGGLLIAFRLKKSAKVSPLSV